MKTHISSPLQEKLIDKMVEVANKNIGCLINSKMTEEEITLIKNPVVQREIARQILILFSNILTEL